MASSTGGKIPTGDRSFTQTAYRPMAILATNSSSRASTTAMLPGCHPRCRRRCSRLSNFTWAGRRPHCRWHRAVKSTKTFTLPAMGMPPGYWVMSQAVWLMRRGTVGAPSGGWSCEALYADSGGEGRHVHPDRNAELRVGISGKCESNLLVRDQQPSATCMDPASGSFPGGSDIRRRRY
jgi:hypothetical protein